MKRKNRTWSVTVGRITKTTVTVTAKTYGAACRRAFKAMGIRTPPTDLDGGWEDTSAEALPA